MSLHSENKKEEVKEKKEKAKLPAPVKSILSLAETVERFLVGYIIITNFKQPIALQAGVYFTATATLAVVYHFVQAYKK